MRQAIAFGYQKVRTNLKSKGKKKIFKAAFLKGDSAM